MKTADEILKEQFGHAYGMLHPFEISRITSAMQAYASQFNNPPVYGQRVIDEIEQLRKMANHAPDNEYKAGFLKAITNVKAIIDEYLPPSPGSVDVEEKKVDGLGDSSGSEKEKSQFREPSTQGGEEKNLQECFDGLWRDNQKNIAEIERLKQENERMKDKIKQYEKPKKQCPKCGSDNVVMFTPDLDLCRNCDNQFI